MKKRYIIFSLIFAIFAILTMSTKSQAAELDRITNYAVTVEPRMNDGTLDITYEITWKVLDSTLEGPLEWVQIGTPNSHFDQVRALSNNISSIKEYNGSYVKVTFDRKYYAGEEITFKYSIHQSYMYKISWGNCNYEFTPAWFTNIRVDNLTIKWNKDKVKKSNNKKKEDNYLVWNKKDMAKGEKLTATIKYKASAFGALSTYKQRSSNNSGFAGAGVFVIVLIIILIFSAFFGGGGGYYGHRGFYGGPRYYGGCAHSSCACACAHSSCASSCACACAGSGRAGCSKKDFYGTNLTTKKIKKIIEENTNQKA